MLLTRRPNGRTTLDKSQLKRVLFNECTLKDTRESISYSLNSCPEPGLEVFLEHTWMLLMEKN